MESPGQRTRRRLRRHRYFWWGAVPFGVLALLSLLGYLIAPDDSTGANRQLLSAAKLGPGSTVQLLKERRNRPGTASNLLQTWWQGRADLYRYHHLCDSCSPRIQTDTIFFRLSTGQPQRLLLPELALALDETHPFTKLALTETGKPYRLQAGNVLYVPAGTTAPTTAPLDSLTAAVRTTQLSAHTYWLGADRYGRDVLSRLILGGRVSLGIGLLAVGLALAVGVSLGALAGYLRGRTDRFIVWLMSVFWSLPGLLLALAIAFALGRGLWTLALAIGLTTWVDLARMVRGEFFRLREREYIEAARAYAYPTRRIILRHLLPNVAGPVLILAVNTFATAVLLEAGLSFLGLGVQPPTPSWGGMVFEGYRYLMLSGGKWLALFPGLVIVLLILSLNLLTLALRDALQTR